jgi:polyvinyl alcohol dehydrogenase (cytochrome)
VRNRVLSAAVGLASIGLFAAAMPATASAAGSCSLLATPGGDWPSYGHDASNTRTQTAESVLSTASAPKLRRAWVFSTSVVGDTGGAFNTTPVVKDGCVFANSAGGRVYALNESTGALQWSRAFAVPSSGLGGTFVGAPVVAGGRVYVLVSQSGGPYAAALDEHTGALVWQSAPVTTYPGSYTNASAAVFNGLLFMGFSPPEGDPKGQGGWALIDTATGAIVKVTTTIPPADQLRGYAGGGIWSTPAFDRTNSYAYVGAGNPFNKSFQHPNTDAILKIDMNPARATFGQVVGRYPGNPDQYTQALTTLSMTPLCRATDLNGVPYPLDDPACGQLDLDFGAAPNLFASATGAPLVGELQKSGVYHAAHAGSMTADWATLVGLSCQFCNASSTAFDGTTVYGSATPGGVEFALDRTTGAVRWATPILDGVHYQSTSTAHGVVYTVDGYGNFVAFDARTGRVLLKHPMALDTGVPMLQLTSGGVSIADHTVFAAGTETGLSALPGVPASGPTPGFIIAYR